MKRLFQHIILLLTVMTTLSSLRAELPAVLTFDTQQKYASGLNVNVVDQFSYYVVLSLGGNLTVKAAGNLINGSNSIPISNINLQLTGLRNGGVNINLLSAIPLVTLSTTPATFYSGLSVSLLSTIYFSFSYQTTGGANFLNKPAGTYSTTLTFAVGASTLATATLSVVINNVGSISASAINLDFNTASIYKTGLQSSKVNLINSIFSNQPYKILVKTQTSTFSNGVNTIPASNIFAAISPASPIALSTSNTILAPTSGTIVPTINTQSQTVDFTTQVLNSAFINKPPGNYTTVLTFSLVDASGNAFPASQPASIAVTLTVIISNTLALTLENGSENAALAFSTASHYKEGVSVTQNNALNIFSNNPYLITVNAATSRLSYLSNHIPVSNIMLLATPSPVVAAILTSPVSLSDVAKTIANASASGLGSFSQYYDLKYYTAPLNAAFINRPPGSYTTTLTFTVTAP